MCWFSKGTVLSSTSLLRVGVGSWFLALVYVHAIIDPVCVCWLRIHCVVVVVYKRKQVFTVICFYFVVKMFLCGLKSTKNFDLIF